MNEDNQHLLHHYVSTETNYFSLIDVSVYDNLSRQFFV